MGIKEQHQQPLPIQSKQNEAVNGTATEGSNSITCHIVTSETKNKGGRPKGSTIANQKQTTDSIVAATNEVTEQYVEKKKNSDEKIQLKAIINEVNEKRGLPKDCTINESTIRRRISRGNLFVTKRGPPSPLSSIEPTIVDCADGTYPTESFSS